MNPQASGYLEQSKPDSERFQSGASSTSLVIAAKRAIEQQLPDRLFVDEYSPILIDPWAEEFKRYWNLYQASDEFKRKLTRNVSVRTRYFDDFLLDSVPTIRQVVLLGSGFDTRYYRFHPFPQFAGIPFFELDYPELLDYKHRTILSSPSTHKLIGADLAQEDWAHLLTENGFNPSLPTCWILEGLLMYLHEPDVHQLLATLTHLSADSSTLGCDLLSCQSVRTGNNTPQGRIGKYWRFGTDDPTGLLAQYGWQSQSDSPSAAHICHGRYTRSRSKDDGSRCSFLVRSVLE